MPEAKPFEIIQATIVKLSGLGLAANTKKAAANASSIAISIEPQSVDTPCIRALRFRRRMEIRAYFVGATSAALRITSSYVGENLS